VILFPAASLLPIACWNERESRTAGSRALSMEGGGSERTLLDNYRRLPEYLPCRTEWNRFQLHNYLQAKGGGRIDRSDLTDREEIDPFVVSFALFRKIGPSLRSGPNRQGTLAPQPTVQSSQVQVAVSS
jgi:hypothetical protein